MMNELQGGDVWQWYGIGPESTVAKARANAASPVSSARKGLDSSVFGRVGEYNSAGGLEDVKPY